MKQTFRSTEAWRVADALVDELALHCHTAMVAGSLRRGKVYVADIEIVFVPLYRRGEKGDDFFAEPPMINAAELIITKLVAQGTLTKRLNSNGHEAWGLMNKLAVHKPSGIPVDLFTASIETFYNYLVCRTGPADSNKAICNAAIARGWKWNPYGRGFSRPTGEIHACESERAVFEFVGLPYKGPEDR